MNDLQKLLDRARQVCSPQTWYALSQRLETSPQRVSGWTRGKHAPDAEACYRLAQLLREDASEVLAIVNAHRFRGAKQADFWNRLSPRVLPATIIALTFAGFGTHGWVSATASRFDGVYIMRTARSGRRQDGFARRHGRRFAARGRRRYAALRPLPGFDSMIRCLAGWRR